MDDRAGIMTAPTADDDIDEGIADALGNGIDPNEWPTTTVSTPGVIAAITPVSIVSWITEFLRY
jgi:hypothetical protein